jgi:hypothetical protein
MGMVHEMELNGDEVLKLRELLTREEAMLRVALNIKAIQWQLARGVKLAYEEPEMRTSHSHLFSSNLDAVAGSSSTGLIGSAL